MLDQHRGASRFSTPKLKMPSLRIPIAVASFAVALAIALLVGWTIIILRYSEISQRFAENTWLLPTGIVGFVIIMATLVLGSVYLGRQILEARRHVRFIDSVTHELKSPLASIRLGLQTLGRQGLAQDQRDGLREMMLDDVERLTSFIDGVLQASRLESDRGGYDYETVQLGPLVRACVARICRRHRIDPSCIDVTVEPDLQLDTDRTALEAVLNNLVDNAVKYSDPPVQVQVRARASKDGVVFEVQDRGIGIPKAQLQRVFERFHRVAAPEVSARKGTGLGLYVAKSLTDQLGGRIRATSDGSGCGTLMTVNIGGRG